MRINKYISQCGICSRREAERKIEEGAVTVNGELAHLGMDIREGDVVIVDGKKLKGVIEEKVVLAMNKPKGYLCTNEDPFDGGKTIFDILPEPFASMKLFCCGRLDKNSEGLTILTNDGELANAITHPSYRIIKRYRVLLNRTLDPKIIPVLLKGVVSEGEKLSAYKIFFNPDSSIPNSDRRIEVWLRQGRKREIRRMFEVMGYYVKELKRFRIGAFELKKIPLGAVKVLGSAEIKKLIVADD